jgi:hypothetical protein
MKLLSNYEVDGKEMLSFAERDEIEVAKQFEVDGKEIGTSYQFQYCFYEIWDF